MRVNVDAARMLATRPGQAAKQPLRRLVERLGYELVPLERAEVDRFRSLLAEVDVACVLDVGANIGQYVERIRLLGYRGPVISFEPGATAFGRLAQAASGDPLWEVRNEAVGRHADRLPLNVSKNSVSSSLLPVSERHVAAAPQSVVTSSETVDVVTLDEVCQERPGPFWLKLDTQGFEEEVLGGATSVLQRTAVVQAELSLATLYEGQADYVTVLSRLRDIGFGVVDLLPGFRDASGRLLQVDVVASRSSRGA